jgi:hypothetical protein
MNLGLKFVSTHLGSTPHLFEQGRSQVIICQVATIRLDRDHNRSPFGLSLNTHPQGPYLMVPSLLLPLIPESPYLAVNTA